jgi:transcriptional regulator with XRE-family HTH domain
MAKDPQVQSDLGRAVKELRESCKLTQEDLGGLAGLHSTYISDIERGARNPSFEVLARLVRALDMPVAALGAAYDRARASS